MDFSSRITRLPRAYDPEQGQDARAMFPTLSDDLADLVEGAAGCSPYLKTLAEKERDWLPGALEAPEAALEATRALEATGLARPAPEGSCCALS